MLAPAMLPSGAKEIRMNLPKRLELLFRCVCALPNASRMGFACRICLSRRPSRPLDLSCDPELTANDGEATCPRRKEPERGSPLLGMVPEYECVKVGEREWDGEEGSCASVAMAARYWMTFLVLSVLPAPDSPLWTDISSLACDVGE